MCLYFVSEERWSSSLQSNRTTEIYTLSVDIRQGIVRVELQYTCSGITFVDPIFRGALIFVGLIFVVEYNHEN